MHNIMIPKCVLKVMYRIGGVMVSVLASSAVDRVKPKTIKLVWCFSDKHSLLR